MTDNEMPLEIMVCAPYGDQREVMVDTEPYHESSTSYVRADIASAEIERLRAVLYQAQNELLNALIPAIGTEKAVESIQYIRCALEGRE